jgi:hypothetical protein
MFLFCSVKLPDYQKPALVCGDGGEEKEVGWFRLVWLLAKYVHRGPAL